MKKFESAGTKDRRAVTVQRISIPGIDADRLVAFNTCQQGRNVRVGNFKYTDTHVFLGDLSGNRFTITLRHLQGMHLADIEDRLQILSQDGFINYYGMQRFGHHAVASTQRVGELILRKQWKEAVELILDPRVDGEAEEAHEARLSWKQGNLKEALEKMPRSHTSETYLLKYFLEKESGRVRNHANALMSLPRNARIMYTHAYQSWLWNQAATQRVRKYGRTVVVGDLVRLDGEDAVRVITKEAETLLFQPWEVVLPLPGTEVVYPHHEVGSFYRETLEQQGLMEALQNGTSG